LDFRFVPAFSISKEKIVSGTKPVTRDDIVSRRDVVSISEAAAYLGVSTKTVRRMIASGRIRNAFWVGGSIRLYAADVEAAKRPVRAS
jgi:excisionase family DNA binding protein